MASVSSLLRLDEALFALPASMIAARVREFVPDFVRASERIPTRDDRRVALQPHASASVFLHALEEGDGREVDPAGELAADLAAVHAMHGASRAPSIVVAFRFSEGREDDDAHVAHEDRWRRACHERGIRHALTVPLAGRSSIREAVFSWAHAHEGSLGERRVSANELYAALVSVRTAVPAHALEVFDELLRLADATLRKGSFDAFDASVLHATVLTIAGLVPGHVLVQTIARRRGESLRASARVALGAKAFLESLVSNGRTRGLREVFYAPRGLAFEARRSLAEAPLEPRLRYEAKAAMLEAVREAAAMEGPVSGEGMHALHVSAATSDVFLRWFGLRPRHEVLARAASVLR